MQTVDLSQRAMLANLSVSFWRARKLDQRESAHLCAAKGTDGRAARVHKDLMPENAKEYDAIGRSAAALSDAFREQTLPWGEGVSGTRILPAANYFALGDAMRPLQDRFNQAVEDFLRVYPDLQAAAKIRLNGFYREEDYPHVSTLRQKFSVHLSVLPFTTSSDFRCHLTGDEAQALREKIEAEAQAIAQAAMQDAWGRLRGTLEKMTERLSATDTDDDGNEVPATYRDTLFSNLSALADLLPRLNLTGDAAMDNLASETKALITDRFSPEQCRRNPRARQTALAEAERILALLPPRRG